MFLGKSTKKLLPPELHFLSPIYTKSFVDWGFAPDQTGVAYSAPPDPVAELRGPTFKGMVRGGKVEKRGEEEKRGGRGEEGRGQDDERRERGREGVRPLP